MGQSLGNPQFISNGSNSFYSSLGQETTAKMIACYLSSLKTICFCPTLHQFSIVKESSRCRNHWSVVIYSLQKLISKLISVHQKSKCLLKIVRNDVLNVCIPWLEKSVILDVWLAITLLVKAVFKKKWN